MTYYAIIGFYGGKMRLSFHMHDWNERQYTEVGQVLKRAVPILLLCNLEGLLCFHQESLAFGMVKKSMKLKPVKNVGRMKA